MEEKKVCCFIGHRTITDREQVREKLYQLIEELILCKHVTTFLFGSKSEFDSLCLSVVTKLKEKYQPPTRKNYNPKSGTKIAYEYAQRKNKDILNIV